VGVEETLERRRGKKIAAKGIYTATRLDPAPRPLREDQRPQMGVRGAVSTHSLGLPGLGAAVLLCTLAPSERYCVEEQGKRHKKMTEWAWGSCSRWLGVGIRSARDRGRRRRWGYASLKLLDRCRSLSNPITFITRLRLDAALYEPAPPRRAGQIGRPRLSRADACPIFLRSP
jgi:hypothetical protein